MIELRMNAEEAESLLCAIEMEQGRLEGKLMNLESTTRTAAKQKAYIDQFERLSKIAARLQIRMEG
jgi:hypothetical protein